MQSNRIGRIVATWLLMLAVIGVGLPGFAQNPGSNLTELQQLRSDLKRIEARIDALEAAEAAKEGTASATEAATATSATPTLPMAQVVTPQKDAPSGPEAVKAAEDQGTDTMDAGMGGEMIKIPIIPALKIRGFGDVRAYLANQNLAVVNPFDPGISTTPSKGATAPSHLGLWTFS